MLKKCVLTILDKIDHLSAYPHVVHITAKRVISRRRKNENVYRMSKNKKCTCKACKNTVFHCQICKFVEFSFPLSSWLLKLPVVLRRTDGTDLFVRACYTCSTLIFPHSSRPQDPHVLSIIFRNRFPLCMEQ